MTLRVAELESVFTANIQQFEQGATKVETRSKKLVDKPTTVKVASDVTGALDGMDRVEAAGKRLENTDTVLQVDAQIEKAETALNVIRDNLDMLERQEASPFVTAEIDAARTALTKVETQLDELRGARAEMVVAADTAKAEDALEDVANKAADAGKEGGRRGGDNLATGIVGALATIPIAGAVVGIGVAAGKALYHAIEDGLGVEVREDTLAAKTGLDPVTVGKLGAAAAEAYAQNWGESIEANMDTARVAVQAGLLDPDATQRDAQAIIESLSGVADVIGEDIPRVVRSTQQLLRTGLAKDAQDAFDIIVKGQQAGLNVSEDWLDTIDEYSTQWRKLGLDGEQVLGLLSQGVQAGARDTDIAADALKEFSIRAIDGSELTKEGFDAIGLSAEEMSAKIAAGGPEAADALEQTLDKLREVEDPVKRAEAAVALFGTQAEDMGEALYAMDLTNAVQQLGGVEGAAQRALDTLGDNTAGAISSAQRNIEVAADGVKGALAEAFAPQLEGFATFVSENRTAVIQFLIDAANGAIDFGRALVEGAAAGTEALGDFAAGPVADLIDALADVAVAVDAAMPGDQEGQAIREWADGAVAGLRDFDTKTEDTADGMRAKLIEGVLDPAQEKINGLGEELLNNAAVHDATTALAADIANVGYAADGSQLSIDLMNGSIDTSTTAGQALDAQVRAVRESLEEQTAAAIANGESQEEVKERVNSARLAFIDQMTAMGLTEDQAKALADEYGLIPDKVVTDVQAKDNASDTIDGVKDELAGVRDKTVTVTAHYRSVFSTSGSPPSGVPYRPEYWNNRDGSVMEFYAGGGVREDHVAQIAPSGAWRVWAEPETGGEAYIPLAPSKRGRSMDILEDVARRFGVDVVQRANGAVDTAAPMPAPAAAREVVVARLHPDDLRAMAAAVRAGSAEGLAEYAGAQDRQAAYFGGS